MTREPLCSQPLPRTQKESACLGSFAIRTPECWDEADPSGSPVAWGSEQERSREQEGGQVNLVNLAAWGGLIGGGETGGGEGKILP